MVLDLRLSRSELLEEARELLLEHQCQLTGRECSRYDQGHVCLGGSW